MRAVPLSLPASCGWREHKAFFLETRFTAYTVDRRRPSKSAGALACAARREFEDVAAVVDSCGDGVHLP
jgi:hypothetical protein